MGVDILEKGLPVNLDAERLVLGSILLDDSVLHDVRAVLEADDFSLEAHRRIWRRACELYDAGTHVDRVTLANALMQYGELESAGGLTYLVSLDDGLPQLPSVDSYVQIIKDDATRRRIAIVANSLITRAVDREPPQQILDSIGECLLNLAPRAAGRGLQSARELVDEQGIERLLAPRREHGVALPWQWLDYATCGMHPEQLWYVAGYTSTGKTSAAVQVAVHAARKGTGVAVFSLEMGKVSLFQRAVYQIARVDSERAKRSALSAEDRKRAADAAGLLYSLPLYFDDSMATTVPAIHAAIRRQRLKAPVGLVIVDYLQLLGSASRYESRAQAVAANSRSLKMAAREFQCPFLVLSQFKRPKEDAKPTIHDFKESGDIENDADVAWFIHRPPTQEQDMVPVSFILAKQREGPRDIEEQFYFFPKFQRFDARGDD